MIVESLFDKSLQALKIAPSEPNEGIDIDNTDHGAPGFGTHLILLLHVECDGGDQHRDADDDQHPESFCHFMRPRTA